METAEALAEFHHKKMREELGSIGLNISGDLNDLRCVSDEQTKTNIEAFIEQLEEGK